MDQVSEQLSSLKAVPFTVFGAITPNQFLPNPKSNGLKTAVSDAELA
jgi:hypothetical protein